MRSTLSQSYSALARRTSRARHRLGRPGTLAMALLFALVGGSVPGCDGSKLGDDATRRADPATTEMPKTPDAAASAADYAWPTQPDPPIWRLEIDGATGPATIEIELLPTLAPRTVAQILEWSEAGYFDGTTFHRVIKGFMIQGGDPNTRDRDPNDDGLGGPGFALDDEYSDAPFVRGAVAMANRGRKNSAGSQFFILQQDARELDGRYTLFGRVRSGIEVVDAIVDVEIDPFGRWGPKDRPIENVVLTRVRRAGSETEAESVASTVTEP